MNWYERHIFYVTAAVAVAVPFMLLGMMLVRPWFVATFGVDAANGLTP